MLLIYNLLFFQYQTQQKKVTPAIGLEFIEKIFRIYGHLYSGHNVY